LVTEEPQVVMGGLFVVCVLAGITGRLADAMGGSDGGALFPKEAPFALFDWFNAAIRAESDVN
jgi:hypothetical protein